MRLRHERKAAKLTQTALARQAQVGQGTISKLETRAVRRPSFDVLARLADVLQQHGRSVSPNDLAPTWRPLLVKGARRG